MPDFGGCRSVCWDVLPILSGAQTLPCQTATYLALERSHIGWQYENGLTVKEAMSLCVWSAQMDCHNATSKLVQYCTNACFVTRIVQKSDRTSSGTEDCAYTSVV